MFFRLGFFVFVFAVFTISRVSLASDLAADVETMTGSLPRLTSRPGGMLLSWVQDGDDGIAVLQFARWNNGEWGPPTRVADGDDWFVNWADFPSVVEIAPGQLAAT